MVKLNRRRSIAILAVLILVVLLGASFGGLLEAAFPISIKDNTREVCRDYQGEGGQSLASAGQMFDSDVVYMSWLQSGFSEKISAAGILKTCQFISVLNVDSYRYTAYISTPKSDDYLGNTPWMGDAGGDAPKYVNERDGRNWDLFRFQSDTGDWSSGAFNHKCETGIGGGGLTTCTPTFNADVSAGNLNFKIEGRKYLDKDGVEKAIVDGAVFRMELSLQWIGESRQVLLIDEVRLRDGTPEASFQRPGYKVGETARLCYDLPVLRIDGESAYFLSVLDANSFQPVTDSRGKILLRIAFTELTSTPTGCIDIPVVASMYKAVEPCTNALIARIYSPILKVGEDQTSIRPETALLAGAVPATPTVAFDKNQYNKGDTVKITVSSTGPNVTKWSVSANIGGVDVLPLTEYPATGLSQEITFTAGQSGKLTVLARAYNGCVPSDTARAVIIVERERGEFCELNPDDPACVDGFKFPLWLIFGLIGVVAILLAVFIPVTILYKVIIGLVGVVFFLVAFLTFGVV